jgi:hypothetical protein
LDFAAGTTQIGCLDKKMQVTIHYIQ